METERLNQKPRTVEDLAARKLQAQWGIKDQKVRSGLKAIDTLLIQIQAAMWQLQNSDSKRRSREFLKKSIVRADSHVSWKLWGKNLVGPALNFITSLEKKHVRKLSELIGNGVAEQLGARHQRGIEKSSLEHDWVRSERDAFLEEIRKIENDLSELLRQLQSLLDQQAALFR